MTRQEIAELPRNHRISLYLRCYRDHLEHKYGYHRAMTIGKETEGEPTVDDMIVQTVVEMRPREWPVEMVTDAER